MADARRQLHLSMLKQQGDGSEAGDAARKEAKRLRRLARKRAKEKDRAIDAAAAKDSVKNDKEGEEEEEDDDDHDHDGQEEEEGEDEAHVASQIALAAKMKAYVALVAARIAALQSAPPQKAKEKEVETADAVEVEVEVIAGPAVEKEKEKERERERERERVEKVLERKPAPLQPLPPQRSAVRAGPPLLCRAPSRAASAAPEDLAQRAALVGELHAMVRVLRAPAARHEGVPFAVHEERNALPRVAKRGEEETEEKGGPSGEMTLPPLVGDGEPRTTPLPYLFLVRSLLMRQDLVDVAPPDAVVRPGSRDVSFRPDRPLSSFLLHRSLVPLTTLAVADTPGIDPVVRQHLLERVASTSPRAAALVLLHSDHALSVDGREQAYSLLIQAARNGDGGALVALGDMYELGLLSQSRARAVQLWLTAAAEGRFDAMARLAVLYGQTHVRGSDAAFAVVLAAKCHAWIPDLWATVPRNMAIWANKFWEGADSWACREGELPLPSTPVEADGFGALPSTQIVPRIHDYLHANKGIVSATLRSVRQRSSGLASPKRPTPASAMGSPRKMTKIAKTS